MNFDPALLIPYAAQNNWWKTPTDAIQFPTRVIAQVMDIVIMQMCSR